MPKWKNSNLLDKTGYSLNGLRCAFISEKAIRNETIGLLIMVLIAVARQAGIWTTAAVFILCLLPITIELINTSAEILIDMRLGPIFREEVKMIKDMLSAAVFLSLCIAYGLSFLLIFRPHI